MPGEISYLQIPLYINSFDICVLFKKHLKSGYSPLKLYEYLACGKPVVTSNEIGLADYVIKNQCRLVVDINDYEDISHKVTILLSDQDARTRMGQNGMDIVRNENSWHVVSQRTEKILRQV